MDNNAINKWLDDLARYFETRDRHGEDRAHWADVYNAENARKIKAALSASEAEVARLKEALRPFAEEAAEWADTVHDDYTPRQTEPGHECTYEGSESKFTIADLRRARAALTGETDDAR